MYLAKDRGIILYIPWSNHISDLDSDTVVVTLQPYGIIGLVLAHVVLVSVYSDWIK